MNYVSALKPARNKVHVPRQSSRVGLSGLLLAACLLPSDGIGQGKSLGQQPVLGTRTAKILEQSGLKFKDLNRNGQLDRYEDWRLSAEERSRDLVAKMSLKQKVGFMLISTTRLKNDQSFQASPSKEPITSDFNEEDLVATTNMFTRKPLPTPVMNAAGTTKAIRSSRRNQRFWPSITRIPG